jgi:hypothetical protein
MRRDILREQYVTVKEDLSQFSNAQLANFKFGALERQRQKEILIKASELEQAAANGGAFGLRN